MLSDIHVRKKVRFFLMMAMFTWLFGAPSMGAEKTGEKMEKTTKFYLHECMRSGSPVHGKLEGIESEDIQSRTGSKSPVFVGVERIQDIAGSSEKDPTCGRYRVTYTQHGIKDIHGQVLPVPLVFGYDINICENGDPAIAWE